MRQMRQAMGQDLAGVAPAVRWRVPCATCMATVDRNMTLAVLIVVGQSVNDCSMHDCLSTYYTYCVKMQNFASCDRPKHFNLRSATDPLDP